MSTSIQEQNLIQTIKDLQRRINDLERNQRSIGIATFGGDSNVKIDGVNNRIIISDGTNDRVLIGNL
ncbi:MAG: hypothetical protein ACO3UU_09225 [Minisyncoccia bacterium]